MSRIPDDKAVLQMIKNGRITPEEGLELYRKASKGTQKGILYYAPAWQEKNVSGVTNEGACVSTVLLFFFNVETAEEYKNSFGKSAAEIISVCLSDSYKKFSDLSYNVDAHGGSDFEKLLNDLKIRGKKPEYVIFADKTAEADFLTDSVAIFFPVFRFIKAALALCPQGGMRLLLLDKAANDVHSPAAGAMAEFFRSVCLENPSIRCTVVHICDNVPDGALVRELCGDWSSEVKLAESKRFVKTYLVTGCENSGVAGGLIKKGGTYFIAGGMGKAAYEIAHYLVKEYNARLFLTGRKDPVPEIEEKIAELKKYGDAVYFKADVSDETAMREAAECAKLRYGAINGVINCAGVIKDSFLIYKTEQDIHEVIAPKINGSIILDKIFKDERLDFFMMFSSVHAITGSAGQCDYTFACGFMNHFADAREKMRKEGTRHGASVSIALPPLEFGGMSVSKSEIKNYLETTGYIPLDAEQGMRIFSEALSGKSGTFIAVYGYTDKIKSNMQGAFKTKKSTFGANVAPSGEFRKKTVGFFVKLFSELMKLPAERIDPETNFKEYGIDSIFVGHFNTEMEKYTDNLPKTALFECSDIYSLSDYCVRKIPLDLEKIIGKADAARGVSCSSAENVSEALEHESRFKEDGIAVIGISGRYPQADNIDEFWANLIGGKDCVTEIPKDRWNCDEYFDADPDKSRDGKIYCKWGGFINGAYSFDAKFFGISPREAQTMDPQERLFMECVYHAVENAGYSPQELKRSAGRINGSDVGVFAGVTSNTYMLWGPEMMGRCAELPQSLPWSVSNRISYTFGFTGPSISLDTACSSSLTSLHLACESLKRGECGIAVAGGVNLYLHPIKYLMLCQKKMLSKSGRCNAFGENADGFVPGEGVGSVILKPLANAIEDGDTILAVIKGTQINHSGATNGYTVPNPAMQAELIRKALAAAKTDARSISYIEAHGTGTALGDPIEVQGIAETFTKEKMGENLCSIGTVKSNIGHLEAAAGIAALTKVILQFKNKKLAPTIHCEKVNPRIDFAKTPLKLQTSAENWNCPPAADNDPAEKYQRCAGIASFGAGGSNAYVIVGEYVQQSVTVSGGDKPAVIVLSAKDKERLQVYASEMLSFIQANRTLPFNDFAYTLCCGRTHMQERLAFTASGITEAAARLTAYCGENEKSYGIYCGNKLESRQNGNLSGISEKLKAALENSDLERLAALWAMGADIDWNAIYKEKRRRIPLPCYPFMKTVYGLPAAKTAYQPKPGEKAIVDLTGQNRENTFKMDYGREIKRRHGPYHGDEVKMEVTKKGVAVITMQDIKNSNMMTDRLYDGLVTKFNEIQQRPEIKAVVLTSEGKNFCMGGTMDRLGRIADMEEKCAEAQFVYKGLLSCRVPVISAMNGHAFGGGLVFGLFADIVILSLNDSYSANFVKYGFTPGVGATYILKEKLGGSLALEMMFTGAQYTGWELKQRGASVLFADREKVLEKALEIADTLADGLPITMQTLKKELSQRVFPVLERVVESEVKMHDSIFENPEVKQVKMRISERFAHKNEIAQLKPAGKKIMLTNAADTYGSKKHEKRAANSGKIILKSKTGNQTKSAGGAKDNTGIIDIEKKVLDIIAKILYLTENDINVSLSTQELGMDSITGVEFIKELNRVFGLELQTTSLYDFQSVRDIISYIAGFRGQTDGLPAKRQKATLEEAKISPPEQAIFKKADAEKTASAEKSIRSIIASILYLPEDGIDINLSTRELGMDSITGVEFIKELNRAFDTELKTTDLYDFPSVKSIIDYMAGNKCETVRRDQNKESAPCMAKSGGDAVSLLKKLQSGEADLDEIDRRLEELL